ncbi:hypothetical protein GCM10012280_30130 [Wenjunlia tyrosinilytica]|uniref:Uncharacterized protein n=1 Tax=Wenjunlia tyrosinilytica TaxID=1544741 RepID=A0A918DXK1_9ACTN|nr:hypothetical protein GCM10012280_30130 [Wenjunlia tyrosinilytica]
MVGAATAAPYSLLVPVFGMSSAWLLQAERITPTSGCAAVLLITGTATTALRLQGRLPGRTSGAPGPQPADVPVPEPVTEAARVPGAEAGLPAVPGRTGR